MGQGNKYCANNGARVNPLEGNIYLVGMMGAGKSSAGKMLASRLKKSFYDSDKVIEERTGVSISTIFHHEGEEGFRAREEAVIAELTSFNNVVLATGGGAILREKNRRCLQSTGFVVYLKASIKALWERTHSDKNRPLLQKGDPYKKLSSLYDFRDPIYSEVANLTVQTGEPSLQSFVRKLEHSLIDHLNNSDHVV